MPPRARPRLASQFVWFVIALTTVLWLTRAHAHWLHLTHVSTVLVGLLIVVVSEAWPIELGRGHISLSSAGYMSVFIIAGVTEAFWVILAGTVLSWLRRGFRGLLAVATLAVMTLTLQVSSWVYHALSESPVVAALLFAITFLVVNHFIVNMYYRIRDGRVTQEEVLTSLAWDGLGWGMSLPLVAIYVLLDRAYHSWWVGLLGLASYASVSLLLSFYYQMRASQTATRRAAQASAEITGAVDKDELMERVKKAFLDVTGFTTFVLYGRDPDTGLYVRQLVVHPGADIPYPEMFVKEQTGLTSWALATGIPEFVVDSRQLPSATPSPSDDHPIVSGFILPLVTDRMVYGVIALGHDYPDGYNPYDFEMAKMLAQHTAVAYRKWMLQEETLYLSRVDPQLVHVYNYRYFREVVQWRIENWLGRPVALAFLDLDGFKLVNDRYGHVTGDRVLALFSEMVKAELRENDVFARYGGDEFVVLFDNVDQDGAARAIDRIQRRLASQDWVDLERPLGVSAGFALFPNDGETAEKLLNTADLRMYQNKMERKSKSQKLPYR